MKKSILVVVSLSSLLTSTAFADELEQRVFRAYDVSTLITYYDQLRDQVSPLVDAHVVDALASLSADDVVAINEQYKEEVNSTHAAWCAEARYKAPAERVAAELNKIMRDAIKNREDRLNDLLVSVGLTPDEIHQVYRVARSEVKAARYATGLTIEPYEGLSENAAAACSVQRSGPKSLHVDFD